MFLQVATSLGCNLKASSLTQSVSSQEPGERLLDSRTPRPRIGMIPFQTPHSMAERSDLRGSAAFTASGAESAHGFRLHASWRSLTEASEASLFCICCRRRVSQGSVGWVTSGWRSPAFPQRAVGCSSGCFSAITLSHCPSRIFV